MSLQGDCAHDDDGNPDVEWSDVREDDRVPLCAKCGSYKVVVCDSGEPYCGPCYPSIGSYDELRALQASAPEGVHIVSIKDPAAIHAALSHVLGEDIDFVTEQVAAINVELGHTPGYDGIEEDSDV